MKKNRVRFTTNIEFDLDVTAYYQPAEPDVGIMTGYISEVEIHSIMLFGVDITSPEMEEVILTRYLNELETEAFDQLEDCDEREEREM